MVERLRRVDLPWLAVGALAASKVADAVTTFVGVTGAPSVREANPVAAATMAAVGVPLALVVFTVGTVVVVTAVTEAGAAVVDAVGVEDASTAVRATGYGLATTGHVAVAAHNVAVLAAA